MPVFKALSITERNQKTPLTLLEFQEPSPGANELLVEVVVAAQNPIDWKMVDYDVNIHSLPWTHGGDISGIVSKVGSNVTKFRVGDRIISFLTRETARHGAYQTYSLAAENRSVRLPDSMSFENGATIPLAFVTAAAGSLEALGLKLPHMDGPRPSNGEPFLVWGGASSVGAFAIQIAKFSGYTVLTTASPVNFEYVKSLGADHIFDYHDANVVSQIREAAGNNLSLVYDAISVRESTGPCTKSITSPAGGTVAVILNHDPTLSSPTIKVVRTNAAAAEKPENGKEVYALLDAMLRKNALKPNRLKLMPGGLLGVNQGLELGRTRQISGEKLVYRIAETAF